MFIPFAVACAGLAGAVIAGLILRSFMAAVSASRRSLLSWGQRDLLQRLALRADLPPWITPDHLAIVMASTALSGAIIGGTLGVMLGSEGQPAAENTWLWPALLGACSTIGGFCMVLHGKVQQRKNKIDRALPFFLDMMTLCVESGAGLHSALQQAVQHSPPGPLRDELLHALASMRAGAPRAAALKACADRSNTAAVRYWVAAMVQADILGMSLGRLLREHAAQCRTDRLQHAEKLAMQAPVKMLLPLIGCIFPCTFIVLAFPIVMQVWESAS